MVEPLTPAQLRERMEAGEDIVLLDVREHEEVAICQIEGSTHIPMGELSARLDELDPDQPIVCICHHGIRSANVAMALEQRDFDHLFNLTGGVERWAREVDPKMRRY